MSILVRRIDTALAVVLLTTACAHAASTRGSDPAAWSPTEGVATAFTLTCRTDGSWSVSDDVVQAQPDGVHLRVVNEYDEPVSVGGIDADPGTTSWTITQAPGRFELSCWPFSEHGSGEAPGATAIEVVDPSGLFVRGELDCPGESMTSLSEYGEAPDEDGPPPMDVARDAIGGLRSEDIVQVAGYPHQENPPVIVIRDGTVIASYAFVRFDGKPWSIAGASACSDVGLDLHGRGSGP